MEVFSSPSAVPMPIAATSSAVENPDTAKTDKTVISVIVADTIGMLSGLNQGANFTELMQVLREVDGYHTDCSASCHSDTSFMNDGENAMLK